MRGKADDAGVLSHGKEENAASRKKDRKDWTVFKFGDYNSYMWESKISCAKNVECLLFTQSPTAM